MKFQGKEKGRNEVCAFLRALKIPNDPSPKTQGSPSTPTRQGIFTV
jgi:hypothetical protein